jgi:hypothetical protein
MTNPITSSMRHKQKQPHNISISKKIRGNQDFRI